MLNSLKLSGAASLLIAIGCGKDRLPADTLPPLPTNLTQFKVPPLRGPDGMTPAYSVSFPEGTSQAQGKFVFEMGSGLRMGLLGFPIARQTEAKRKKILQRLQHDGTASGVIVCSPWIGDVMLTDKESHGDIWRAYEFYSKDRFVTMNLHWKVGNVKAEGEVPSVLACALRSITFDKP